MPDIIHPDSREDCSKVFQEIINGERLAHFEAKLLAKDGSMIIVKGKSRAIFKSGQHHEIRSIFRNISERRQVEEKLRLEYQRPPKLGAGFAECRFTPERSDNGEIVESVLVLMHDITKRHEAEEKLRLSEEHYRYLVEGSQGLICTHDLDGKLLSINLATLTSLGYSAGEMVGRNLREFIPPEIDQKFDQYLRRIRK